MVAEVASVVAGAVSVVVVDFHLVAGIVVGIVEDVEEDSRHTRRLLTTYTFGLSARTTLIVFYWAWAAG